MSKKINYAVIFPSTMLTVDIDEGPLSDLLGRMKLEALARDYISLRMFRLDGQPIVNKARFADVPQQEEGSGRESV